MKRILIIIALMCIVGSVWGATYYDSSVISVLELENNITDSIAPTVVAYSMSGTIPYSNSIYKYGSYSIGPGKLNSRINATSSVNVPTLEFYIYLPSSVSITTTQMIALLYPVGYRIQIDTNSNMIACISINMGTLSRDTWTHIAITSDGSNYKGYVDGVYKGQRSNASIMAGYRFMNELGSLYFDGYMDRIVMSNIVKTSFPSLPDHSATPTYTPTVTPTVTPTATPTFTVTPTYTPTATPTKSSPIILTVTPNITPWWWWWSQKQKQYGVSLCKLLP
jgi:hypothetical protein